MANDNNLREVYETLKKEGYTPPEFETFRKDMQDDNNLRGVHKTLMKEGYTPPEFSQFKTDMFGQSVPGSSSSQQSVSAHQSQSAPAAPRAPQAPRAGEKTKSPGEILGAFTQLENSQAVKSARAQERQTEIRSAPIPASVKNGFVHSQQPTQSFHPSEQDKIRAAFELDQLMRGYKSQAKAAMERSRRVAERYTPEGRRKQKSAKMRAQMAGTPTSTIGLTPATGKVDINVNIPGEEQGEQVQTKQQSPLHTRQGAVPYGVKDVDGKRVTEWLLPDGRLTTDFAEADASDYMARQTRLSDQFSQRMRSNGLDPAKKEDVERQAQLDHEAPIREAIARAIAEDDARDHAEQQAYNRNPAAMVGGVNAALGHMAARKQAGIGDLFAIAEKAYGSLDEGYRTQLVDSYKDYFSKHPEQLAGKSVEQAANDAAKSLVYSGVREEYVARDMPKSKNEFFLRKIVELNPAQVSLSSAINPAGQAEADMEAMNRYGSEHKGLSTAATVIGMAIDPWTYASGFTAGAAKNIIMKGMMKASAKGLGKGMAKGAVERLALSRSLVGRLLGQGGGHAISGGLNFGIYEAGKEAQRQIYSGGYMSQASGELGDYNFMAMLGSGVHGLEMGAVVGPLSPMFGNAGDYLVSKIAGRGVASTVGKAAVRVGSFATAKVLEGTIFAAPEIYEFQTMPDAEFDGLYAEYFGYDHISDEKKRTEARKKARGSLSLDAWVGNEAMMLGFGLSHIVQSAPAYMRSLRKIKPRMDASGNDIPLSREERVQNRKAFMEILNERLSAPQGAVHGQRGIWHDMKITEEEKAELAGKGYGSLADIFTFDPAHKSRKVETRECKEDSEDTGALTTPEAQIAGSVDRVFSDPEFDGFEAMERLMQDKNVSEAVRAKLYFILTGHILPVSTIMGWNSRRNPDGSFTVSALNNDGSVVTSRTFASEREAKMEEADIHRQCELNTIDIGERYRDKIAQNQVIIAAVEAAAPGSDPSAFMKQYEWISEHPDKANAELLERAERFEQELERNSDAGNDFLPETLRERLDKETGLDVDEALKKMPKDRTDEEKAIVERYVSELFPAEEGGKDASTSNFNDIPPSDMPGPGGNAPGGGLLPGSGEHYQQGQALYEEYEQGDPQAPARMDALVERLKEASDLCEEIFGDGAEDLMYRVRNNPWDLVNDPTLEPYKREAVLQYINAREALKGLTDAADNAAEERIRAVEHEVDARTHKEQGVILPALLHGEDEPVFIVKGDVAMHPDGSGIDTANSSDTIIIRNMDGDYKIIDSADIKSLEQSIDPMEEKANAFNAIEAERDAIPEAPEASPKAEIRSGGIPASDEAVLKNAESVPNIGENTEISTENRESSTESVLNSADSVENGQETALSRIPLHEETGEPMFEAVEKELAWDGLVEAVGNDKDAADIALAQIEQANADLEALKKKPPTMKAPKLKGSPMAMAKAKQDAQAEYAQELADYNQRLAEAQARLNSWMSILGVHTDRTIELRRQQGGDTAGEQTPNAVERNGERTEPVAEGDTEFEPLGKDRNDSNEDTPEEAALRARISVGDEWEEDGPSLDKPIYKRKLYIDGKHEIIQTDAPNDKGSYVGSTLTYDGRDFGDLKEIVDYIDEGTVPGTTDVNLNPTPAQKEAGNYKKGHVTVEGMRISIENPKGSTRSGVDANGNAWETRMTMDYGYIRGTQGKDKDHIDIFLTEEATNPYLIGELGLEGVYVIDQYNKDGSFDEHKVVYGVADAIQARMAYLDNYSADWADGRRIEVTEVSMEDFKKWALDGKRKIKPFAQYKSVRIDGTPKPVPAVPSERPTDALEGSVEARKKADSLRDSLNQSLEWINDKYGTEYSDIDSLVLWAVRKNKGIKAIDRIADDYLNPHNAQQFRRDLRAYNAAVKKIVAANKQIGLATEGKARFNIRENEEVGRNEHPIVLDVVRTIYEKGKTVASKLFQMKFFDVVRTPDFMKKLGLTGDKFTIRYGVIARHFGKDSEHTFPEEIWQKLPDALSHPFAISKYYTDKEKKHQKGYRLYTYLQLSNGAYVVVSAEVKNAGRNVEVNAINTIFGRSAISELQEEIIYISKEITPEQQSLLNGNNPHQYPAERELSDGKINTSSSEKQAPAEKSSVGAQAYEATKRLLEAAGIEVIEVSDEQSADEAKPHKSATSQAYTITQTTYTRKKGKGGETPVWVVKFNRDLSYEEKKALVAYMKESMADGKKTSRGWMDRESGDFFMRSEEAAKGLGELLNNEEAVADAQPLTADELRDAVAPTPTNVESKKPAKPRKLKKAPINRVSLEDVMTDLADKGETILSDHAEPLSPEDKPTDAKPESQHEISDDEMASLANELRDLLGISDDEGDTNIRFRDPGELTPQERQKIQSVGIRLAMGMIERGVTKFPDLATRMVAMLGDKIRPWMKSFYEGARWTPGYEKYDFTPNEEVAKFNVENFDKPAYDAVKDAEMRVEERKAQQAAEQADKELKETRNKQRKENDKQREADTAALAEKADAVAKQAETDAKSAEVGRKGVLHTIEKVDETIEEINDQLALLGYYEAEENDAKFHESYGYMLTAEKKAVADAATLAKQLVKDLGIDLKVTSATTPLGRKSAKKGTAVRANLAPAGGDVMVNLPLNEGRELVIYIGLDPVAEKGSRKRGDNLAVERIMYRVENPNGSGMERYGRNIYAPTDITYGDFLRRIKNDARDYIPKQEAPKTEESHEGYKRGDEVMWDRYGNGKWENVKIEDFDDDGSPIFEAVKGIMSEKGDWSRVKPAEGVFGEAKRVATKSQAERKKAELPAAPKDKPSTPNTNTATEKAVEALTGGRVKKYRKKEVTLKADEPVGGLFANLFDEPETPKDNEKRNGNQPSQGVAGGKRVHTVGTDETGTDGRVPAAGTEQTDKGGAADEAGAGVERGTDSATHGTHADGGLQPLLGDRGRDEDYADSRSAGAAVERDGTTGAGSVSKRGADRGTERLSEGEPASESGHGSGTASIKKQKKPEVRNTRNFRYDEKTGNEADSYTPSERLEANVKAIETLAEVLFGDKPATEEQRAVMSRFRGWGQVDLGKYYDIDHILRNTFSNTLINRLAKVIQKLDPQGEKKLFDAIKRASLSSYYTPTPIARAMNTFLGLAGYKGGSLLDPSMGNGMYEGTLPKSIQERTAITGVELDWISGQLSRMLYPDANVMIGGFEKSGIAPGSFDVVTSNVPFGDIVVNDPTWKNDATPLKRSAQNRIHNYYAVKMLEAARPGGLVAMLTTSAVMDTPSNQNIRAHIADQGEILGAIRLPDNTFQGTGVVTDILFIRKWRDDQDRAQTREDASYMELENAFLSHYEISAPNKLDGKEEKVRLNGYFEKNPCNLIGEMQAGNQYGKRDAFGLTSKLSVEEIAAEIEKAVKRIVGGRRGSLFNPSRTIRESQQAIREAYKVEGDWVSNGNLVIQDGKVGVLTAKSNEYGETTRTFEGTLKHDKMLPKIKAMIGLRTAMKKLIAGQIEGANEETLKALRGELQEAYDKFVGKYGRLQDKDNAFILDDIDGYTLQALETWKSGKFVGLSDIFTKNSIKPALKLDGKKTPQEAVALSLAEYGYLRPDYMVKALGENWVEQCGDFVFLKPNSVDDYVTRDEYLSGDVVTKLAEVRAAAEKDDTFTRNVKALEEVQPARIPFDDIAIHLGARWIPENVLNDFVNDIFGIRAVRSNRNGHWDPEKKEYVYNQKSGVRYIPETDSFEINIEKKELGGAASDWETPKKSAKEILQAALEDKTLLIKYKDKEGNEHIDEEQTELANQKIADLRERFESWLPSDPERVDMLEQSYNDRFNRTVIRHFDGSHLVVPGLMGKELRPHQKDAVWMLINNRGGIVDHIVGAGKTLVMQSAIMEMRRMGIAKKPMIVALKSTVSQIAREFKEAFPSARVLAPNDSDFKKENRKKFIANISLNDYDCVILSHEQYCMLPHTEEAERAVIDEQMWQLDNMIEYLYGTNDSSQLTKKQIKALEKRRENLKARLEKRLDRNVDREFCFENLGIDYMFVDESHQFKSLPYVTSYQKVAGLGDAQGSSRAVALLTGIRHLQRMHQGDKGTVFLSGTTITNSLVEIYNLLNYLRPRKLEELGMPTFDAWASVFAVHSAELEAGVTGNFAMKDRFRSFDNVPELSQLYAEIADVRNDTNLKLPKPAVDGRTVIVPASESMQEINSEIVNMLESKDGRYFSIYPKDPNRAPWGLHASTLSAKAAVSPRLIFPDMEDDGGKVHAVCENVKKYYDEQADQLGVQLIFCEMGVPDKSKKYDAYTDMGNRFVNDYGIPRSEIAYIQEANTEEKRKDLFQRVRDGKVRILIGGTKNMGTGVNVQDRITDMHMLTVPWTPSALEQCIGRGARQGNLVARDFMDNKVRVHYYATEGSLDLYKYQLLDAKGKMFTQFKMGTVNGGRSFDEGSADEDGNIDPAEMVAILSGNPVIFERAKQEKVVKKLRALRNGFERDYQRKKAKHDELQRRKENFERLIRLNDRDRADLEREGFKPDDKGIYPTTVTITEGYSRYGGRTFDKPKEAGEYLLKMLEDGKNVTLQGFGQRAQVVTVNEEGSGGLFSAHRELQIGTGEHDIKYTVRLSDDATAAGTAFRNLLKRIMDNGAVYRHELEEAQNQLAGMNIGDGVFSRQAELDEAVTKLRELNTEYNKLGKKQETNGDGNKYRLIEERELLDFLDGQPLKKGYRYSQWANMGVLPPMTAKENGEWRAPMVFSQWEQSEEGMRKANGKADLVQGNGRTTGDVAYNPYFHIRTSPLNDQFTAAYDRPELLVVEGWYPESEETSGYRAEGAKDSVGLMDWHSGSVNGQLSEESKVQTMLSRYFKPGRIVPWSEVADLIMERVGDQKITFPINAVPPMLRAELAKRGAKFGDISGSVAEADIPMLNDLRDRVNAGEWDAGLEKACEYLNAYESSAEAKEGRVMQLSQKLNTPIRVISDEAEIKSLPTRRQRRAKGWWSNRTGEVVVVLPNNVNVADVENTVVHEVVGHKGLRAVIGEERFDEFLGEVYDHASNPIRMKIDKETDRMVSEEADRLRERKRKAHERAGEDYNSTYYTDMAEARVEAEKKREEFRREATEEYMSDLGGRIGDEGFEKMSRDELTLWGKIKAKVQGFLDKFLRGLKIAKSIRLNDKDLSYILFKSWRHAKEGGKWKGDLFTEAEDSVRRRGTRFDEIRDSDRMKVRKEAVADRIEALFDQAVEGKLTGKPVEVGRLTAEGKAYLEKLSGIKMKENVSFVLNPSDLVHMYRDHFGNNEKDKGNNIPLSKDDIRAIGEVISYPERIVHGKEPDGLKRNLFYFLSSTDGGTYNLLEIYGDRKGNFTAKTFYKTKKAVSQRVLSLMKSEHLTSVTDGASLSDGAKLPKFFEYPKSEGEEDKIFFRDPDMSLEETITKMKTEAMQANTANLQAKRDAMRAIGGNLNHLRQAMARQREYDITTAKNIKDLARILMENGLLDNLGNAEVKSLLAQVTNSIGRKDISMHVNRVFEIMVNNHLRNTKDVFGKLISMRTSRADGRGINVQGELDPEGEAILKVFNSWKGLNVDDIDGRIADAIDAMSDSYAPIAERATLEYAGLLIARDYAENVAESKKSEKILCEEIKKAKEEKDAGRMTADAYRQFEVAIRATIQRMKLDRIAAYESLMEKLGGELKESVERAKAWRESEKERVNAIHHLANSDMQGRELRGDREDTRLMKLRNSWFVNWLLEPMSTLDQMLKMFGNKNPNGEGYMQNHFMRGWIDAADKEQEMKETVHKRMDEKAAEIFGKHRTWHNGGTRKVDYTYSDLYDYAKAQPGATIEYYDGAEMREYEIGQGELLYLYAVDKMPMGRATNRRMGIDDATMQRITDALDPKLKEYADWVQDELLPRMGDSANEVHKKMFGADMDAIDNYFPFVRDKDAIKREVENGQTTQSNDRISVQTGAIKKRVASVSKWNMRQCNFMDVLAKHVDEMTHWTAFAELNRDFGTLLSYNRLKQQVFAMNSVYGAGEQLWKRFQECCAIATDAYEPQRAKYDRYMVQGAKGVTMGKISLRIFTALKQTLSLPAFFGEVNMKHVAADLVTGGVISCKWAWKNMPNFRKRILSRTSGDYRLKENEYDGKIMKASSYGMLPNIGVDAWTIAVGSHGVYKTRKAKYLRWGMEESQAERRAVQDAELCFNKSQQSSEGPFMAPVQVDHTFYATTAMLFRNSSTSYTREAYASARNLKRLISGEVNEEYVAKQILRTIHPEAEDTWTDAELAYARKNAKREVRSAYVKNTVNLAMFGWVLPWLWRIGSVAPLLLLGGDDEEKQKQWEDAMCQSMFAPIEGLAYGDVISDGLNYLLPKVPDKKLYKLGRENPIFTDIEDAFKKADKDLISAANDVINILGGMTIGINPQTITDWATAIIDFNSDEQTQKECALLVARLMSCPQSQLDKIYLEELDMDGIEANKLSPEQLANRYARYKMMREAPITGRLRSQASADSIAEGKKKRVRTIAKEKLNGYVATEETKRLLAEYDSIKQRDKEIYALKDSLNEYAWNIERERFFSGYNPNRQSRIGKYKRDINELTQKYLKSKTPQERDSIVLLMLNTRDTMLQEIYQMH